MTETETALVPLKMNCPLADTEHLKSMSKSDLMVVGNAFPGDDLNDEQRLRKAETMVAQFALYIENSEKSKAAILGCVAQSIAESMLTLASLDLPLTKSLGYAALIPYSGVCTVALMYQGLGELMMRTGTIGSIQTGVVYEGDEFSYELGSDPRLKYSRGGKAATDDKLTHAWCIAHNLQGPKTIEVMERSELDKVRRASKMPQGPAWKGWFSQMCRKAPMRRMAKYMQTAVGGMAQSTLARGLELENSQFNLDRTDHYKGVRQAHSDEMKAKAHASLAPPANLPAPTVEEGVQEIKDRMLKEFGNKECAKVAKTVATGGIIRTMEDARAFEKILNAGKKPATAEDGQELPPELQ